METVKAFFRDLLQTAPRKFGDYAQAHPKTVLVTIAVLLVIAKVL